MSMNGSAAHDTSEVTTAVIGSAGSSEMSVIGRAYAPVVMPFFARVRLSTMAAPSNGVPSWNVTPERAVMRQTVKSSLGSID